MESSISSMLLNEGDMAKKTFSGETCSGICLVRSVDAIEHSSFVGSCAVLSLSKQDIATSRLCDLNQSMLSRTSS